MCSEGFTAMVDVTLFLNLSPSFLLPLFSSYSLSLQVVEHSEELKNKDKEMQHLRMLQEDIEYKYVIADSKLSEIEKEHEQRMSDVKDKVGRLVLHVYM